MQIDKVYLVSGTGASGSSALFDYINCFPDIFGVEREMKKEIRKDIYNKWVKNNYLETYKYKKQLSIFLQDVISHNFGDNFKGSILLNNSISALNLDGLSLFDNLVNICVLRDPRSTWVAWQTEWKTKAGKLKWSEKDDPVGEFILSYKRCMDKFYFYYNQIKDKHNIYLVNFEDFCLDKDYRLQLLKKLDLDISLCSINPASKLRPFNNTIFAHKFYENKKIIARIKNNLESFCHEGVN